MTDLIRSEVHTGVATITLDSPANRNALSRALLAQLGAALSGAARDPAVRAIVLSHTGPVFCSGADLKETRELQQQAAPESPREPGGTSGPDAMPVAGIGDVLAAIWESPKPVIARVGGPARAGGLGLIAAADIAVCARTATFAFSEVRIGVIPAVISATVLRRLTPRPAAELYLTGDVFDGTRAAEIGLVTAAVAVEDLDAAVARYAASLVRGAPGALAGTKELLRGTRPEGFRADVDALTTLSVRYFGSDEGREGIAAFRDKRDPAWIPPA